MDLQYVVSRQKITKYVAKYATKSEPRSKALQDVYRSIIKNINDDGIPLKVVQKLLTSTVGERDFSTQETCLLLLMLPMVRLIRDFVVLNLDGSREVDDNLEADKPVTNWISTVHTQIQVISINSLCWNLSNNTTSQRRKVLHSFLERRTCLLYHVLIAHQIQTGHNMNNTASKSLCCINHFVSLKTCLLAIKVMKWLMQHFSNQKKLQFHSLMTSNSWRWHRRKSV